jgi:hypothetical protein
MQLKFKANGIPELTFLFIYVMFGDRILEYFIHYILRFNDLTVFFVRDVKYGLYLKYDKE